MSSQNAPYTTTLPLGSACTSFTGKIWKVVGLKIVPFLTYLLQDPNTSFCKWFCAEELTSFDALFDKLDYPFGVGCKVADTKRQDYEHTPLTVFKIDLVNNRAFVKSSKFGYWVDSKDLISFS